MSLDHVLARAPGIVARAIAGETILVPIRRRAQEMGLYTLNGVGTWVWERLDGRTTLREIAAGLHASFDVDPACAEADVAAFAADLERAGCAVVGSAS